MKKIITLFILSSIIFTACTTKDEVCTSCDGLTAETVSVFVDGYYTDSTHQYYFAQLGDTINENNWEIWETNICGFDFAPGYRYKLSTKRQKIGKDDNGDKLY